MLLISELEKVKRFVIFLTMAGDHTETGGRFGRGAVRHAAQQRPQSADTLTGHAKRIRSCRVDGAVQLVHVSAGRLGAGRDGQFAGMGRRRYVISVTIIVPFDIKHTDVSKQVSTFDRIG